MQRITITLPEDFCDMLDSFVAARGYTNRSEACRDLMRAGLQTQTRAEAADGSALAALSYVFNHETRNLARRLTQHHHDHHDLSVCTTHVHLDHETCMEVTILRGQVDAIRAHADGVLSQRGVMHGNLFLVPVEEGVEVHGHAGKPAHAHTHLRVKDSF